MLEALSFKAHSRWRAPILLVALVGVLALAETGYRRWVSAEPDSGSELWIWSADDARDTTPRAFYLVKDLQLPVPPARAELSVVADEEYLLYLNGQRIGSNAYQAGAPMDRYEVGPLLLAGGNRLLAEVRSRRGTGGFLLRLEVDGREAAVSDATWRVFRRYDPGLFGGWLAAQSGEPTRVWGRPPTGRWRLGGRRRASREAPRPLLSQSDVRLALPGQLDGPLPWPTLPERFRGPLQGPLWPPTWIWPGDDPRGDPSAVEGYLELRFPRGAPAAGLLFLGSRPAATSATEPTEALVSPPGAPSWSSAVPRRLGYVAVVAVEQPDAASVLPAPHGISVAGPRPEDVGLFGIAPPPRNSPIEAEVLRLLAQASDGR